MYIRNCILHVYICTDGKVLHIYIYSYTGRAFLTCHIVPVLSLSVSLSLTLSLFLSPSLSLSLSVSICIYTNVYIYTHFYVCNTRLFVYSYVSGEKEREGEREIYIYWLKAQDTSGSRPSQRKKRAWNQKGVRASQLLLCFREPSTSWASLWYYAPSSIAFLWATWGGSEKYCVSALSFRDFDKPPAARNRRPYRGALTSERFSGRTSWWEIKYSAGADVILLRVHREWLLHRCGWKPRGKTAPE